MKRWFYLVVAVQLLFLVGEAVKYGVALSRGQVVTLEVEPIDPRSLFLGNYLALSYEISTLDLTKVAHDAAATRAKAGQTVYVVLTPGKPWAQATEVVSVPPTRDEGKLYLKGRVEWAAHDELRVEYGLERYYLSERAGARADGLVRRSWERKSRPPQLTAEVAVQEDGQALLKRVLADGKPLG